MVSFYSKSFCIIGTSLFLLDKRNPSAAYYAEGQEKRRNGPRRHDVRSAGASSQAPAPTTVPKMHAARRRDRLRSAGRPNGTPQPPEARPTKLRRNGVQGTVQPTRSAPQPHESDCGAHGAPSEEEKSFGLRGGCKDGCGGENSRDGCWAGRGEDERPENRQPSGNQRPEAAAAGACPVAGAAGAAGVSTSSAGPSAAESFVAESSAAAGASNRGTPSI